MVRGWEECPSCGGRGRNLFKVKLADGIFWLFCSATGACRWKIKLSDADAAFREARADNA